MLRRESAYLSVDVLLSEFDGDLELMLDHDVVLRLCQAAPSKGAAADTSELVFGTLMVTALLAACQAAPDYRAAADISKRVALQAAT